MSSNVGPPQAPTWREVYEEHSRQGETFEEWLERAEELWGPELGRVDPEAGGDGPEANTTLSVFPDQSIRFVPPYTKDEAAYRSPDSPAFDPDHDRCETCVHYIPGFGCHFVQGEIDPAAYCERFYADYGVFAHDHGDEIEVNAELVGEDFHPSATVIDDFVDQIEARLERLEYANSDPEV